ncbi:hypothetical protein [Sphingomonas montanisoli]|uniref:TolC family protein n=1 Tax=Sphingomonas montanisoli TaxID=2606412 RepID=A0A5D9C793_9SPHN|nr:hypothetical protein [Sphingomonas montanisoli]TZG27728.1 hypothetical protein FYJ91_09170 [Sphingomonas montanisoli]
MLRTVRPMFAVALLATAAPAFATTAAQGIQAANSVAGEPRGAERLYPTSTLSLDSWRMLARVTRIEAEADAPRNAPVRAEADRLNPST